MAQGPGKIVIRVATATLGGYVVASGFVALVAVGLPAVTRMARSEAVVLASMLGFIIYLALLIWGFASPRLSRLALAFTLLAVTSFALVALIGRLRA
jgi:hypothetical protein